MKKRCCNLIKKQVPKFKTTQKIKRHYYKYIFLSMSLTPKLPLFIFYVFMYLFCLVLTNWLKR